MDAHSLRTASDYLNNLLLARGLLRNGKPINFARPTKSEGGPEATMAHVINLVHDLVLRRDRESEQRETLVANVRILRATESRHSQEIERLQAKNAELTRAVSLSEGQDRIFKTTLRSAENTARALREEMVRLKSTLAQVRTQCANDVRKRDVQIQKMKTHLTGLQRGKREGMGVTAITITPAPAPGTGSAPQASGGGDPRDPGYSLKQETTEFLTGLCQNLSDENDALIGLVRNSVGTLRDLQGLPGNVASSHGPDTSDGHVIAHSEIMPALPASYDTLATEVEGVLSQLRTLLTNPSFVPIEEVEARDEEIVRLREGWMTMESRWKEALKLMNAWRTKITEGAGHLSIEELTLDLARDLGSAVVPEVDGALGDMEEHDESQPDEGDDLEEGQEDYGAIEDDGTGLDQLDEVTEISELPEVPSGGPKNRAALGETEGNPQRSNPRKRRSRDLDDADEGSDSGDEIALPDSPSNKRPRVTFMSEERKSQTRIPKAAVARQVSLMPSLTYGILADSFQNISSHLTTMTIEQKLAAVEAEAQSAAKRRMREQEQQLRSSPSRKRMPSASKPLRKTGVTGRPNRRRSTLNPAELDELMGVSVC